MAFARAPRSACACLQSEKVLDGTERELTADMIKEPDVHAEVSAVVSGGHTGEERVLVEVEGSWHMPKLWPSCRGARKMRGRSGG
jgi:hypothetical protein